MLILIHDDPPIVPTHKRIVLSDRTYYKMRREIEDKAMNKVLIIHFFQNIKQKIILEGSNQELVLQRLPEIVHYYIWIFH